MVEEEFSSLSKTTTVVLCFISIGLIVGVGCQDNTNAAGGFINIDCGYEGEDYKDTVTGLTYKSDASFIDRGVTHKLSKDYANPLLPQCLATLRSFPNDSRICYALRDLVQINAKYLIRAWFMYGNYDGLNSTLVQFDLHLGVHLWKKINITSPSTYYAPEVVTVAESDSLTVCLVAGGNTGSTLFMSALELRPLATAMYPAVNVSNPPLVLNSRKNMGASALLRYPQDMYDRIWVPYNSPNWIAISTESQVGGTPQNVFRAPSAVFQTAVVPADNRTYLEVVWDAATDAYGIVSLYHVVMYFAEINSSETKRTFNVYLGNSFLEFTPQYLLAGEVYTVKEQAMKNFTITIVKVNTSMYPPILNALETYTLMTTTDDVPSDATDVAAIMKIKVQYQLKRNWMGDPCAPKLYSWNGLDCNYSSSPPAAPRIIALNLSSSGLTGDLADSFRDLTAITNLDLSENNLTRIIPEFLADITSLKVLNLSGIILLDLFLLLSFQDQLNTHLH